MSLHSGYSSSLLRAWQQDHGAIHSSDLVFPLFITDSPDACESIDALPGLYRYGVNRISAAIRPLVELGLRSVLVFGIISSSDGKDERASPATDPKGPTANCIRVLKHDFPELVVIADVCMCPYSSHGHCGFIDDAGVIDNAASIERMAEIALFYAQCGADIVAPSDMMDGRIGSIKHALISNGFGTKVAVMSYAAKFASAFYGPFRDACKSSPGKGDRSAYQLPPGSRGLALRACRRDMAEGADIVMVKPAGAYLDIIAAVRTLSEVPPVAAYQVSGEYAMLYHASQAGSIDLHDAVLESVTAIKRAGATIIITYFTPQILQWIANDNRR